MWTLLIACALHAQAQAAPVVEPEACSFQPPDGYASRSAGARAGRAPR